MYAVLLEIDAAAPGHFTMKHGIGKYLADLICHNYLESMGFTVKNRKWLYVDSEK